MAMQGLEEMARAYKELDREKRRLQVGGRKRRIQRFLHRLRRRQYGDILRGLESRRRGVDRLIAREDDPAEAWIYDPDRYCSNERIAVYMACMGNYDALNEPVVFPDNVDYYLITDMPAAASGMGQAVKVVDAAEAVPAEFADDPVKANRWCKMHPHILFPDHEISIYVDSNLWIVSDLTALTHTMKDFPMAMFRHKNRDCVYDEITACIIKKKDTEESLRRHEDKLRALGIPAHLGLVEAPVLVRRHHDSACIRLMNSWWEAFLAGCRRDQIAMIEALWRCGLSPETLGTLGNDVLSCDLLIRADHLK